MGDPLVGVHSTPSSNALENLVNLVFNSS